MDGTLIEENIGVIFAKFLLKKNLVHIGPKLLIISVFVLHKLKILGFKYAIKAGAWCLAGLSQGEVRKFSQDCFDSEIQPKLLKKAIKQVKEWQDNGSVVAIATGAHEVIADRLADHLTVDHCIATKSEIKDGTYGYRVYQPIPFQEGKRDAVTKFLNTLDCETTLTVYTDEAKDIPLLSIAETLVGVDPDEETRNFVTERGGSVVSFRD